MNKANQLKLNTGIVNKIKYYVAFSYLLISPLFKAKMFEYFDYDIEKAFLADKNDFNGFYDFCNLKIPQGYFGKKNKLDIDECYKNAFLDNDIKIVTWEDEKYPPLLKEIPDFPLALFYKGNIENIDYNFNLAVVGSRLASESAKLALNNIISELNGTNITIVSGLAYGIDAQAHISAIKNNLTTIAVIGSGLDIQYPTQNKHIYSDIISSNGVIFSEYPLKTSPMPQNFPQRNRIVTGMSKGTLVAEAKIKSGAMISANLTLDYNRELMCIPGNILNPNTTGIYHLIKNGAGIVCCAKDLLNNMGWDIILKENKTFDFELNEIQKQIIDIVSLDAQNFDKIADEIKANIDEIMVALTELEIKGLIKQSNNRYYKC